MKTRLFMMLMAVVAMMTTMSMNAQNAHDLNARLRVGGDLCTLTGNKDFKQKLGWSIGADFDYGITDQWAVSLDLSHDYIGAKSKSLDKKLNLEYISFGPMAKYYATPWLALQAGPEIGFLVKAKMDGTNYKDACKKTEFSLPIGVSFEPNLGSRDHSLIVDLRYRLGLSKVNKKDASFDDMRNSALILAVGYKFSLLGE